MPNLLAFDVSNLIHRVYHATAAGTPEDRIFNFARARVKKSAEALIREVDPIRVVAAFDSREPSFRHRLIDGYKGHRGEKPETLTRLLDEAPAIFAELGAECLEAPGYEADDVMATVADQCLVVGGWRTILCTNDADLLSCIYDAGGGEGVFVLRNKEGTYHLWNEADVQNSPKYGVPPMRLSFLKSIAGDVSDGYSGIPGLGLVAARRMAKSYPSMKRLYASLEDPKAFTKSERKKLEDFGFEQALVMEKLARLVRNAPLGQVS